MKKPKPSKKKSPIKKVPTGVDFGKRFQAARLAHGSSQRDVALRMNSNVTTISRYEISSVQPSVSMAAAMAQAVEASLDQLCGLAEADTPLVVIARKASAVLTQERQQALISVIEGLIGPASR
jgi:transcriptional regulator with XRE-family HTH domain